MELCKVLDARRDSSCGNLRNRSGSDAGVDKGVHQSRAGGGVSVANSRDISWASAQFLSSLFTNAEPPLNVFDMDAFERVVAMLLERDGYWIRQSVRVKLTKQEKIRIGRPSSPRWELDLVGYRAKDNSILVVECKSYLDSPGVRFEAFDSDSRHSDRYKLFVDSKLRRVVLRRLLRQLAEAGAVRPNARVTLCLAAGKTISPAATLQIRRLFVRRGWQFWDAGWIGARLRDVALDGYENDVAAIVAKLLLRSGKTTDT